jgi:ABC-type glycerol-3-phosphate transport system substrate-binding protein
MLKNLTLAFVALCLLGGVYEFTLRDRDVSGGKPVLRIGAEGWQITEFKLQDQIARFGQEHPEIRVELHQLPSGYETSLFLQASLKDLAYDVILSANNYTVDRYCTRGLLLRSADVAGESFQERIMPGMLRGGQVLVEGSPVTYLIPYMGEVEVLNYRKDLFQQAGLTRPPQTWQEFEEYADRLNRLDPKVRALSLSLEQGGFFLQNTYLVLLRSLRGSAVDETGRLDIYSPESREVFRMLKRWWKKGLVSPSCMNTYGAADDFKAGLTAMYPNWQSRGLWALRNENLKGKVGFAPLPDATRVGSLICVYGGFILKGTKVQQPAAAFLTEAMCGYAQPDIIAAGKMPVRYDTYQEGKVPDWMIDVGKTIDNGYTAPEPTIFSELAEFVSVAFHRYLASDGDDPSPMLEQAARDAYQRIYSRRE